MNLTGRVDSYTVGKLVAETDKYRLYLCRPQKTDRECLLQVTVEMTWNGVLDKAAYLLGQMSRRAAALEEEYVQVRQRPHHVLNYQLGFPELLESFIAAEQGGCRVNILAFNNVEQVGDLVPLRNITRKDRCRIDLKSSVWILGKALKMLIFAHSQNILIKRLDTSNILIEPKRHYVVLFDWTEAELRPSELSIEDTRPEVMAVTQAVITVLGGQHLNRFIPGQDEDEHTQAYAEFLYGLANGRNPNPKSAQEALYRLVQDDFGWKGFHPFTTHPLE